MPKSPRSDIIRRQEIAGRLHDDGYGTNQISRALGVTPGQVIKDLNVSRPDRQRHASPRQETDPPPQEWHGTAGAINAMASVKPLPDTVTRLIRIFCTELDEMSYLNVLAHVVADAVLSDDQEALGNIGRSVQQLVSRAEAMDLILKNAEFRENMATTNEGRTDIPRPMRSLSEMDVIRHLEVGAPVSVAEFARRHNCQEDLIRSHIRRWDQQNRR